MTINHSTSDGWTDCWNCGTNIPQGDPIVTITDRASIDIPGALMSEETVYCTSCFGGDAA